MNSIFSVLLTLTTKLVQVTIKIRISREEPTLTPAQKQNKTKAKARRLLRRAVTVVTVLRDLTLDLIPALNLAPTPDPNPKDLKEKALPQKVGAKTKVLTLAPNPALIPAPSLVPSLAPSLTLKVTQPQAPTPAASPAASPALTPGLKLKKKKPRARNTVARASLLPNLLASLLLVERAANPLLLVARAVSLLLLLLSQVLKANPLEARVTTMTPKR